MARAGTDRSPQPDEHSSTETPEIPKVAVFSPGILTSITIERDARGGDEVHVHPAGQGYWVARMLVSLGAAPTLCCTCGGELGDLAAGLVDPGVELRTTRSDGTSGAYIDDRRDGERARVADMPATPLNRHTIDDLIGSTVAAGIDAGIVVLCGSNLHGTMPADMYTSLARNLHGLGVTVVADLSGDELHAAIAGHVDVLKVSHGDLVDSDLSESRKADDLHAAGRKLSESTGATVFLTRASRGTFAYTDGRVLHGSSPRLETIEHRGAGDSFTAAAALAHTLGWTVEDQLRFGAAAAAANVLRHGLGSATHDAVRALTELIEVKDVTDSS